MNEKILTGVARFQKDVFPKKKDLFERLALSQEPLALFITCADSRVAPNLITNTEPGDLFICRNAGNIIPPHSGQTGAMTASIEYAVAVLEVEHIIVCGHSDCGAMKGAMQRDKLQHLPHVNQWLTYSEAAVRTVEENMPQASQEEKLERLIEQNVLLQMQHLRTHPYVAARLSAGKLQLHGWIFDIATGGVSCYDENARKFVPLADSPSAEPQPAMAGHASGNRA
jgi:carbonic anhydrase